MQSTRTDTTDASIYECTTTSAHKPDTQTSTTIVIGVGGEAELLLDTVLDAPAHPGSKKRIRLVRGGREHAGENMVEIRGSLLHSVSILETERDAVGYLLGYLEQHDIPREQARDWVASEADVQAHDEWRSALTRRDRRDRLFESAAEQEKTDPTVAKAMQVGEWRDTELSAESADLVRKLVAGTNRNGRKCYETAQRAIRKVWNDDRVRYCEGYTLPYHATRGTRHAWVEVDGSVLELTWPWHMPVDGRAEYYGTEIPRDVLAQRMNKNRRGYDPMLLDDEEFDEMLDRLDT